MQGFPFWQWLGLSEKCPKSPRKVHIFLFPCPLHFPLISSSMDAKLLLCGSTILHEQNSTWQGWSPRIKKHCFYGAFSVGVTPKFGFIFLHACILSTFHLILQCKRYDMDGYLQIPKFQPSLTIFQISQERGAMVEEAWGRPQLFFGFFFPCVFVTTKW